MPRFGTILKHRIGYAPILLMLLLYLTFLSSSQALFYEQEWTSAIQTTLHLILIIMAGFAIAFSELMSRRKGKQVEENAPNFVKTLIFGGSWFFVFVALINPGLDIITMILMFVYFWRGACIEELTFRYSIPRLFNIAGYGYWISQIISNLMFSFAHFFVWEFSLVHGILGMLFGFLQSIAFAYGKSFMGIVWSHCLYNLALIGVPAWFLILVTVVAIMVYYVRSLR
jgi:hypothetical protein